MRGPGEMPDAPLTNAEYQRRWRERHAQGARHMRGDVPADLVHALIGNGWLGPGEAEIHGRLGAALIDLADCWMNGTLAPPKT